jgi:hypothetical protein
LPRIIDPSKSTHVAQALYAAADVDDGPTDEQRSVIGALLKGYFDSDVEVADLTGIGPDETASAFPGAAERRRMRELLVLMEFCRHPVSQAQVERVEEYAAALGESGQGLEMARDLVAQGREVAMADFRRFLEESTFDMVEVTLKEHYSESLTAADPALAAQLRALGDAGPGTLGRAYVEFYDRNGIDLPGDDLMQPAIFVAHDMCHVIAGYEPVAADELALGAMQLAIDDSTTHWVQFLGNIAVHEAGFLTNENGSLVPKEATLNRPGATQTLAHAFNRGARCGSDFTIVDHLAMADRQLDDVRAQFAVPPREC